MVRLVIKYFLVLFVILNINFYCQIDSIPMIQEDDLDNNTLGESIAKLPSHIPLYNDIAYLYADFENVQKHYKDSEKSFIPVFLINNSQEIIIINGYEEPELQQEYEFEENKWIRTQPYHYGWCGTQYLFGIRLKPGEYYCFYEYFLEEGDKEKLRYTFLNKNIASSNSGLGRINKDEVEKTKYDDIALNNADFEFLKKLAKGEIEPYDEENENNTIRLYAIEQMSFRFPVQAIPVIIEISNNSDGWFKEAVERNLEEARKRKCEIQNKE